MINTRMLKYFKRWETSAQYHDIIRANIDGDWRVVANIYNDIKIIYPMPMRPEEQEHLPEGLVYRDHLVTWTETAPTQYTSTLIFESNRYEIVSYSDRKTGLHYRLILRKQV